MRCDWKKKKEYKRRLLEAKRISSQKILIPELLFKSNIHFKIWYTTKFIILFNCAMSGRTRS